MHDKQHHQLRGDNFERILTGSLALLEATEMILVQCPLLAFIVQKRPAITAESICGETKAFETKIIDKLSLSKMNGLC